MKLYKTERGPIINLSYITFINPVGGHGWDYLTCVGGGEDMFELTEKDVQEILKLAEEK